MGYRGFQVARIGPRLGGRLTAAPVGLSSCKTFTAIKSVRTLPRRREDRTRPALWPRAAPNGGPGEPFQVGDSISQPELPGRRLRFAGQAGDLVVVHFEPGGAFALLRPRRLSGLDGRREHPLVGVHVRPSSRPFFPPERGTTCGRSWRPMPLCAAVRLHGPVPSPRERSAGGPPRPVRARGRGEL